MKKTKNIKIVFFIYVAIVIRVIIFKYPWEKLKTVIDTWEKGMILAGLESANFTLFKTIRMYVDYSYKLNSFENLAGNIVVFIPLGFLLPYLQQRCKKFSVLMINALVFVLGIEVFQLFSAFGAFDVDDILLNCVGAGLGWLFHMWWQQIKGKDENIST
ncbi:MAG: VanZ family protein [Lachnospiraceae bacterium]|nr:VanZ family protein [Lachnospiraceae bacterium]